NYLLLAFILPFSSSLDPEVEMNAEQIITYWKYPFEEHTTQTEDGYVLTLFRIKHGRHRNCSLGPPFILAHGLGASAEHWLMNPPSSNPAFLLADAGFDVWLINFRGAKNSKKHVKFKPDSSAFWNFCWDEMAEFDLPATIDTVRRVNGAARVYYAGHSQGTTVLFGKLAMDPSFGSKIARFFALAPITTARSTGGPMIALHFLHPILQRSNEAFGGMEFVLPTQYLAGILARWVCPYARLGAACKTFISMQGGSSRQGVFNQTRSPVYFSHYPGSSSLRNFAHWGQMIWRDNTRKYDYGSAEKNQIYYGQSSPPLYNFSSIRNVSIHIFYSSSDVVASVLDVEMEMIGKQLRKDVVKEAVNVPGYSHNDFIAGMTIKTDIIDRIVNVIRFISQWKINVTSNIQERRWISAKMQT
ncbi:hypothetical protein PMAYCL1PPCAC_30266, partial [Pristionchus mayeri]